MALSCSTFILKQSEFLLAGPQPKHTLDTSTYSTLLTSVPISLILLNMLAYYIYYTQY